MNANMGREFYLESSLKFLTIKNSENEKSITDATYLDSFGLSKDVALRKLSTFAGILDLIFGESEGVI